MDVALIIAAVNEGGIGKEQVGIGGEFDQRVAHVGVATEHQHLACALDPMAASSTSG